MTSRRRVAVAAFSALTTLARAEEEEEPEPLPGVKPFVALFLDEASRSRLAARYPLASGRSASYVLLEATKVTSDKTRPAIFAPLMGEPATATVTGKRTVGDLSTLRTDVRCAGGPIEGMSGYVPSLTWGGQGDDDAAHRGAEEGTDGLRTEPSLELTGTVCRGDYWHGQRLTGVALTATQVKSAIFHRSKSAHSAPT